MGKKHMVNTIPQWVKHLALGIPMIGVCLVAPMTVSPASAGIKIDKFELSSDFRLRYEIDDASDKANDRDRARVRYRFGMKYELSDRLEFGSRFATNSSSIQSPHQTLGQLSDPSTGSQGRNEDFGLDRAYMKFKLGSDGFLWLGKNGVALWQQNEQFWDADFQAEGAAIGNTYKIGDKASFTLQGGYYFLNDTSFNFGVGEDDVIIPIQGVYKRAFDSADMVFAATTATVVDNSGFIPGGDEQYNQISGQLNFRNFALPITLGYDSFFSDDEEMGYVTTIRTRLDPWTKKIRLRFDWAHIPLNSVPAQGMISQDDFRFSSNFEGAQIQLDYDVAKNYNISFRFYPQDTENEAITLADAPGLGNFVQAAHDTTRFQVNLNVKF